MSVVIRLLLSLLVVPIFTAVGPAYGQAYPNKPIKLVIPFPPGGPLDLAGRAIAQKLQDAWGQPVVVENRLGLVEGDTVCSEILPGLCRVPGELESSVHDRQYARCIDGWQASRSACLDSMAVEAERAATCLTW